MKVIPVVRALVAGACAALWAAPLAAAGSPREHLSLDAGCYSVNNQFIGESHDRQAQPIFDAKAFLHIGDNVIAAGVNNGGGEGGLNPNVNVQIIGHATAAPWSRSLFNGLAQVIVQSTRDAGEIKLAATAGGLAPAPAILQAQPCALRPSVR
jgi:beta-galactosidase